jgi:ankyrin repeat protein
MTLGAVQGDATTAEQVVWEAGQRADRARELLEAEPGLRTDRWVALSLGDVSGGGDADVAVAGGPLRLTPLAYVVRSRLVDEPGAASAVRALLARGADPNGSAGEEWSILSIVCAQGRGSVAELLLAAGAEPNDNDSLYHSVETDGDACTRLLLEYGAVVDGTHALHHALDYDRLQSVRLLLDYGADPNQPPQWPALHHAVARGRSADFVRLLLERGADAEALDGDGRSAAQLAYRRGADDLVALLDGARSPAERSDVDRALHTLAQGGEAAPPMAALDEDAREVLVDLALSDAYSLNRVVRAVGVDFSSGRGGGPPGTLLHQAAWLGRVDYVDLLLRLGAAVDARAPTRHATPLAWAAVGSRYGPVHPHPDFASSEADYVAVAELLTAAGAEIEPSSVEMAVGPLRAWLAERT